ncbi:uncharacterized protein N7469_010629 [Penicillium citrinum]|uniref:Uncharacterized protein n=2 Tax=Penicillium TaxID=5073 RepID=A0A9W9NKN9_PENCI|nr:uncharacterized protein N7469_010629 [Penicillium citrinum]KAJ5221742.1 hypothetical protein N7469_010629 [Penicillium citrinum]KAJ5596710.1 hypothetical protein N7450_003168 [Penicillium hetheringtonii]KAK5797733.1 hypothetical protein VI817_004024 [Penicillium citrinum]
MMIGWARYPELKSKDGARDHDSENIALVCLMTIRSEQMTNTQAFKKARSILVGIEVMQALPASGAFLYNALTR